MTGNLSYDMLTKTDPNHSILLKVIVIGDSGAGKTSLMSYFVDNKFSYNHMPTIGIDFKFKNMKV